jgi:beta-lactamase class A
MRASSSQSPNLTGFGRREQLAAALLALIGCARGASGGHGASTSTAAPDMASRFAELERKYEARLGVCVLATGPTAVIAYDALVADAAKCVAQALA